MLLSFLRLKPFDVKEWWNRVIQRPVTQGDSEGLQYVLKSPPRKQNTLTHYSFISRKGQDIR